MIGWLLLAAALVLGVPAVAFLAQDRMLFLPQLAAAPPGGLRPPRPVEEVALRPPTGHASAAGSLQPRGGGRASLIVYYGGNAEDVTGQAFEPWPEDPGSQSRRPGTAAIVLGADPGVPRRRARRLTGVRPLAIRIGALLLPPTIKIGGLTRAREPGSPGSPVQGRH